MTTKNTIRGKINLSKTQSGYVPLEDRFKSFPKDSENEPQTDTQFYFDNQANQTLEHADIGLLYPTPEWLRKTLNKQGLLGAYRETETGRKRIADGAYRVTVEKK